MVISKWWKWLMHSPPVWQALTEGLKATTLVPNPLGISSQTHVSCGWKGVLMHKHYNMSIDYYFLCFVTLIGCILFVIVPAWVENYACFSLLLVFLLFIDLTLLVLFLSVLKKIQKPIKIENSLKSLITCIVYISCEFSLVPSYLWRSAFTSLACYVCIYIFVRKSLKTMGDCCK